MAAQVLFASPRPLPVGPDQALSPEESLAVVDIFINAAIACICHTRALIPWDSACFQTRYIDDLLSDFWKNGIDKYSAFCGTEPTIPSNKSQEFRVLRRGEDGRADSVLDLIETAVFSAVGGGFLEAVKFFITQGGLDCKPTDVLESYTLSFNYENEIGNERSVRSISVNTSPAFTTENTVKSFHKAIKSLLNSLQGLPTMPRRRSVGVAMLYNQRCPPGYCARGFLTEDVPYTPGQRSAWQKLLLQEDGRVGKFEVGPYEISVGASNVRPSIPTSSQSRRLNMSKQLQGLQKSSSQRRSGLAPTLDDPGSQIVQSTPATLRLRSNGRNQSTSSQILPRSSAKQGSQQNGQSTLPVMSSRSRKRNVVPQKIAEIVVHACAVEAHHDGDHIFDSEDLEQNELDRLNALLGGSMRCECYDQSNDGMLLLCLLCGTSQHAECYGWNDFPDAKLPDEHFCYSCLLLPQEADLNAQMPTVVHKRLALAHIQQNNPTNADDVMDAMHLSRMQAEDNEVFNAVVDGLQEEGYLTRSGLIIRSSMDQDSSNIALRDYVNPLAKIAHHFSALKDRETAINRTNAIAAAVEEYTGGRAHLPTEEGVSYDSIVVQDAFGENIRRWGFYPNPGPDPDLVESRKRRATTPPVGEIPPARRARLASVEGNQQTPPYQIPINRTLSHHNRTPLLHQSLARKASYHEGTPSLGVTPPQRSSIRRKASCCDELVNLDRSSPSTVFDMDEVFAEAVHVATSDVQWASGEGRR